MIVLSRRADIYRAAALGAATAVVWCVVYHRLTIRDWRVPLFAESDALTVFAGAKSAAEGSFLPLLPKFNPHLGAPYAANWNDFPVTNEPLILVIGLLSKVLGLFAAANLLVLIAQVLAAVSFYAVCRLLDYRWQWSAAGGWAFGLSPYAFQRGLAHLNLTHYWYLPFCLLVCWWCVAPGGLQIRSRRFWLGIGVALVAGVNNPYYTNVFLQLLGFAALSQILRRSAWRTIAAPVILGLACFGAFLAMNVDTIYYQAVHGKNAEAARRTYQALEIYALKPLELFIPPENHRWRFARAISLESRYDEARKPYVQGEGFSLYLGLAGLSALTWLGVVSAYRVLGPVRRPPPIEGLAILWVVLYSVVGGVNGFLGQAGLMLFRCTNRFSIYILALALLFGVKSLTRLSSSWRLGPSNLVMLVMAMVICWDQLPPRPTEASIIDSENRIASDRAFTEAMEKALPASAMVFQLPVMSYPESWPIVQMMDYEHLRPYLYSSSLRFSYGSDKGRARDSWQLPTSRLPVPEMVAALEGAGFSAVYVNRRGYADRGAALLAGLEMAGRGEKIESPAGDLVCVLLHPSPDPELPDVPPEFAVGWYGEESDARGDIWHYSSGNAQLVLSNLASSPRRVQVGFELASPSPRTVDITVQGRVLYRSPRLGTDRIAVTLPLLLQPGTTSMAFETQPPITFQNNPDTRLLGFLLYNLRVETDRGSS